MIAEVDGWEGIWLNRGLSVGVGLGEILTARAIAKSFAGVRALRSASIELLGGEVHALIGENGAGKSTLAKVITGALSPDSGELRVFREVVEANSLVRSRELGIAAIYQHPSLFPHLTVAENIALSLESRGTRWRVDWKGRNRWAGELLESIGAEIDGGRLAGTLSMAEQQMVEIAKAIGVKAKILLMDEPTALLTSREVDRLFGLIARLRVRGWEWCTFRIGWRRFWRLRIGLRCCGMGRRWLAGTLSRWSGMS